MKKKPCPQCRTIMELKNTTLHFKKEGFYADVENLVAYICPQCGTRSIHGATAAKITKTVDNLFKDAKRFESHPTKESPSLTLV